MECEFCGKTTRLSLFGGHVCCNDCRPIHTKQCRAATNDLKRCTNHAFDSDVCAQHIGWTIQDWIVCDVCAQQRLPEYCHRCAARQRMGLYP